MKNEGAIASHSKRNKSRVPL